MSNRWRVIDCSSLIGVISSTRGGIEVTPEGADSIVVPVADVGTALIGPKVLFSQASLHRMLDSDIAVLFCDWKGVPEGGAYSWREHSRVGARHRAQTVMSTPRQKNAWGSLIRAKIQGQSATLRALGRPNAAELSAWAKLVRSGDPSNLEARAARLYWQSIWEPEPFRRTPGQRATGESTRNSQLDYAYTVLRGAGIRAVLSAGLSPTIGLFHHGRSNNFSLVDDLIEPFRPAVDFGVATLPVDADMSDSAVRSALVKASDQQFTETGLRISSVLEDLAQQFGQYVEGERARMRVLAWSGPHQGRDDIGR